MLRRAPTALLALSLLALAGCLETGPSPGSSDEAGEHVVTGAFTENATSEDVRDLGSRLAAFDATVTVMESFPMQYQVRAPSAEACEEARAVLAERAYVSSVGACSKVEASENPEEPTSSG